MPGNDVNEDIAEFLNCDQFESQFERKGNLENHIQSRHNYFTFSKKRINFEETGSYPLEKITSSEQHISDNDMNVEID